MRSRIIAIPLLAVVWTGSPAFATTQDPDTRVTTMPVPDPDSGARAVAPRFKEVMSGEDATQSTLAAAEQRGVRGGGRSGSRRDAGGGRDNGGGRTSGGERTPRGGRDAGNWDGDRGRNDRPTSRVVVVPRSAPLIVNNYAGARRNYFAPAISYDPWIRRAYGWSPVRYAPWGWIYGTAGFASLGIGFGGDPYYAPYSGYTGYGYYGPSPYYGYGSSGRSSTFDTGGVRLRVRPRDAQVFVDGYYAGVVDDFDGVFQDLRLAPGGHKIEVRMPGYETAFFDVMIQPGRTLDLREDLRPRP